MLRIAILTDNNACKQNIQAEHGLSLFVETEDMRLIFDTGETDLYLKNADAMGIDLSVVNTIALSHCHYDHCGGLAHYLKGDRKISVYAHPDVFRKCYADDKEQVGFPWQRDELEKQGAVFHLSKQPIQLSENIFLTGQIPSTTSFENIPTGFYKEQGEKTVQDLMFDDQALVIKTENGLVILLGCSHSGVINTIKHITKLAGTNKILAVIGGMHLGEAENDRINKTVRYLMDLKVENIIPLHCTGDNCCHALQEQCKEKFHSASAGNIIEFSSDKLKIF